MCLFYTKNNNRKNNIYFVTGNLGYCIKMTFYIDITLQHGEYKMVKFEGLSCATNNFFLCETKLGKECVAF